MAVFSIRWRRVAATFVLRLPAARQPLRRNAALYSPPDLSTVRAVAAEHGMVVAQEKLAAQVGADILQAGRQCGRRRGRHRLCACRHLSARRQHRRRRLYGDSFGRAQRRRRHRLSRDRDRPRSRATFFWDRTANPITTSRAIPRSASACPARSPDWRWRWRNTAPAVSRWRKSSSPPSNWRATASWSPTTWPTRCRTCIGGCRAGRIRPRRSPAPTARRCRKATG